MNMQNHLLFEELLLSDQSLTTEQTIAVQEHLQICESCRLLASSWREVERVLHRAPMADPGPNFMQRWETRLAFDRLIHERRQNLMILCFCIGGSAGLLLVLASLIYPAFHSMSALVLGTLYQIVGYLFMAEFLVDLATPIFRSIFNVIPPTLWIALFFALSGLCVIWLVALQQLTTSRRSA